MPKSSKKKSAKHGSKSSFVRSLPANLPAKAVVAKAKEAGITLTDKYVYVIRSEARKRSGGGAKRGRAAAPKAHAVAHKGHTGGGGAHHDEATFRKLVVDIGVARAHAVVVDVERRLKALFSGH